MSNDSSNDNDPYSALANIDPFNVLAPTRANFSSLPAAASYYEVRAKKARHAEGLLRRCAMLARTICESAAAAAADIARLTPDELRTIGLTDEQITELRAVDFAPEQLSVALAPMIFTFAAAATIYDERAKLLETTVVALLREALAPTEAET
ncbi:MAG TPA: hypothetical protein VFN67_36380 [Polyangiales bacterium]|nr:hypothetical protein [Polyangiales bacterium]